jgi:hypothetical protein
MNSSNGLVLQARPSMVTQPVGPPVVPPGTLAKPAVTIWGSAVLPAVPAIPAIETPFTAPERELSVGAVLRRLHPAPYASLLVGLRMDGKPCFLDLNRPSRGPVLVTGDPACGKTRQLQVMVDSAVRLSLSHEIQVVVVSSHPAEWDGLFTAPAQVRHLLSLYGWYDPAAGDILVLLAKLAEERRNGQRVGAAVLLVLDDLAGVQAMDFEGQASLHNLLLEGPQDGVWPLASLDAKQAAQVPFWVDPFHTRLVGRIASPRLAQELSVYPESPAVQLAPGVEFSFHSGQGWITYQLPRIGD